MTFRRLRLALVIAAGAGITLSVTGPAKAGHYLISNAGHYVLISNAGHYVLSAQAPAVAPLLKILSPLENDYITGARCCAPRRRRRAR